MAVGRWMTMRLLLGFIMLFGVTGAFAGETDPFYRSCVEKCEQTGRIGETFFQHCQFLSDDSSDRPWYMQEPLYLRWRQWNCRSDCHYNCMIETEKAREEQGLEPVKYRRRWLFKRVSVFQEPVSAALSALNLIMHFHGWLSFFLLVYYKLPLRPQSRKTLYEYTGLWHIYGILAMNALFWSAIYHIQDFDLIEQLDYSSTAALVGYTLVVAILRTFNVKDEASRVMVAAPLLAFITTHILYLNFYQLDLGLNTKVCFGMVVAQLLLWAVWAGVSHHPSRYKIWMVIFGGILSLFLDLYGFPPYKGYVDSHTLLHAIGIPLTYIWWSFVRDDAVFQTSALIKKAA